MQVKMHMVMKWQACATDCKEVGNPVREERSLSWELGVRAVFGETETHRAE